MAPSKRLVLFDIDGTLMSTGGVGRLAFKRAMEEVYGPMPALSEWTFAGKTDPQIVNEVLASAGHGPEAIEKRRDEVLARYLRYLEASLPESPQCHAKPGVHALLEALAAHEDVSLGLLTGNLEPGARIKLTPFGLFDYFAFGAYGSDHADRRELPAIAVERAESLWGYRYSGKQIVIIGDTEHDIRCGASLGVRAIAVATGPYGVSELEAHGADAVFADLADTEAVLAAIL